MALQNYFGVWLPESGRTSSQIWGGGGNDTLFGTPGNDDILPNGGWDTMYGGTGDDTYWGPGNIVELPGGGADVIRSWASATLPANVENAMNFGQGTYAVGNAMDNIIQGLENDQFLDGGLGNDVLVGGYGADTFVVVKGQGFDVIQDFEGGYGPGDVVRLVGSNLYTFDQVKAAMTQQGADVVLNNGGEMLLFRNITVGQFAPDDFALPIDMSRLGQPLFSEDFNTLTLNNPQTGAPGWLPHLNFGGETGLYSFTLGRNGEEQVYVSPRFQGSAGYPLGLNPFSVSNGVLTISANPSPDPSKMWGYQYTSGALSSENYYSQKYGYFEMRADLPAEKGMWPAFWLIKPNSTVELDILEQVGSEPNILLNATHSPTFGDNLQKTYLANPDGFHTFGVLWTETDLIFYVDRTEVRRMPTTPEMHDPMFIITNLAVGGAWPGSPDSTVHWPAEMKIDYIRAYGLPGAAPAPVPTPIPTPTPTPTPTPPPAGDGGVTLTANDGGQSLTGGAGADVLVAGRGGGTLTGGAGADTFVFKALPWAAARISDFTIGVDKLDLTALFQASNYSGANPAGDGYISLLSDGAGGTKVLYDPDGFGGAYPWHVATLAGVSPTTSAASLLGQSAPPATTPPPSGGGGSGAGVTLTANDSGQSLTGGAGADVLVAGRGGGTLTGGDGADAFVFKALPWAAARISDFAVGSDKLDLTALFQASGYGGSNPVGDGYITLLSDGAGGTKVLYDPDGFGGGYPWHVATLAGVSPTTPVASLLGQASAPSGGTPPGAGGQVLTATDAGGWLVGGAGNDVLISGRGASTLMGGGGADSFVFKAVPWSAEQHIADFVPGTDKIDFTALFTAAGYHGSDPVADGYLRFVSDGADGTKVLYDADGWGSGQQWPYLITTIDHVAPGQITPNDWIFH